MGGILPGIGGPQDIKHLTGDELTRLCSELREQIISSVSRTGGHLGASLGVVELTVALHKVFESPRDKIVWDVGHQAYGHKLLTGRLAGFDTLRRRGGVSGFPKRSERARHVRVGHASTAISAAVGYAAARDARGDTHSVVAVVGDGALTGGLAYEGLNNAGQLGTNLIVILNDNKMSISPNVGAISKYLTRITSGRHYVRLEADVWDLLGKMPRGGKAQKLAGRIKESLKQLVVPTILFEELGFKYYGPLDGHDLPVLIETLQAVRQLKGPILIHLITEKGKGYHFAEQDDQRYHGVGKFDKAEGIKVVTPAVPSYTDVFGETMCELAAADPRVHAITAAMPSGTGLDRLRELEPKRCHDVGIAEGHAVTFAAGLACDGARPVVAIYSTFLQRAVDQIIHDVALQHLPVVFAVDRGGVVGEDGPTHHGVFDLTFLRMVPGMMVMAPRDENQLRHMLATALAREDGPSALRYPRGAGLGVALDGPPVPLPVGRGETLRDGGDACLLAVGTMVQAALGAAELLARRGCEVEVVDMRFIKPLDAALLADVWRRHREVFTIEENTVVGGFGAGVLEWAAEHDEAHPPHVSCLGIPDAFQEHATRAELLAGMGLDAAPSATGWRHGWPNRAPRRDGRREPRRERFMIASRWPRPRRARSGCSVTPLNPTCRRRSTRRWWPAVRTAWNCCVAGWPGGAGGSEVLERQRWSGCRRDRPSAATERCCARRELSGGRGGAAARGEPGLARLPDRHPAAPAGAGLRPALAAGDFHLEDRSQVSCRVNRDGREQGRLTALNDHVINMGYAARDRDGLRLGGLAPGIPGRWRCRGTPTVRPPTTSRRAVPSASLPCPAC
ncbi:MAG: 1-deoxy-D-xylulose-5-phosphate synthase [bacterium]|nr:1-deoxy-D-xylulose-5-phosphate synthase [bacterium]